MIHEKLLSSIFVIHGHFQIYVFRPMAFGTSLKENGLPFDKFKMSLLETRDRKVQTSIPFDVGAVTKLEKENI